MIEVISMTIMGIVIATLLYFWITFLLEGLFFIVGNDEKKDQPNDS